MNNNDTPDATNAATDAHDSATGGQAVMTHDELCDIERAIKAYYNSSNPEAVAALQRLFTLSNLERLVHSVRIAQLAQSSAAPIAEPTGAVHKPGNVPWNYLGMDPEPDYDVPAPAQPTAKVGAAVRLTVAQRKALQTLDAAEEVWHHHARLDSDTWLVKSKGHKPQDLFERMRGITAKKLIDMNLATIERRRDWNYLILTDAGRAALATK